MAVDLEDIKSAYLLPPSFEKMVCGTE